MVNVLRRSAPTFAPLAALAWLAVLLTGSVVLADIAVLKEGAAEWNVPANWTIDGQPATVIPGGPARAFWSIIIDEGDTEANVFLEAGPRQIHALTINGGDTLQIKGGANLIMSTDALEQGGNVINNSGTLEITEQGQFVLQGNNTPNPDDDIVTLRGGGVIALDSQLRAGTTLGARIIGQGGQPRVLLNEDNTIRGHGDIGRGTLKIINRGEVVADDPNEVLEIDPGSGSSTVPGDYTNDGGTARATNRGILRLIAGTFNNINGGRIVAEDNSTVELAFGAHVNGGSLQSAGSGRFVVTGDAFLDGRSDGLRVFTDVDVLDGQELILQGEIANLGKTTFQAGTRPTQLTIDGEVRISGNGVIELATIMPGLNRASIGTSNQGSVLTLTDGQQIVGTGSIEGPFSIKNDGTISANQGARTLRIMPTSGNTLENTGTLQAAGGTSDQGGGVLNLLASWDLTGDGSGTIQALRNSHVLLDGITVSGQRLRTPDNPTASPLVSTDDIDPSQGVIRTQNLGTKFDLRESPPVNQGLLEVASGSRLTLQSKEEFEGPTAPTFENTATILLSAATGQAAEIWVSGGDVRLTGGGQIVLSDNDANRLDQSVNEGSIRTLINVDNLIVGAGNIGGRRLNLMNEAGGTILADGNEELVIETPIEANAVNRGVISTRSDSTLIVRNAKLSNEAGARLQSLRSGTLRVEGGTLTNKGTVAAEGLEGMSARTVLQGTLTRNSGTIEASGGSRVQIIGGAVDNSASVEGQSPGAIAARDTSVVELAAGAITNSGRLESSDDAMIRIVDRAGLNTPITNDAVLVVADGATALVLGRDSESEIGGDLNNFFNIIANGPRGFPLENRGSITVNSIERPSELLFARLTRLTGGGQIILADSPGSRISGLPDEGPGRFPPYLLNVDNTIRGAGAMGLQMLVRNEKDGRIIADGGNSLSINLPGGLLVGLSVAPFRFNFGIIRAEGSGGIELVVQESSNTVVAPVNNGTIEVAAGSRLNLTGHGGGDLLNVGRIVIDAGAEPERMPGRMNVGGILRNGTSREVFGMQNGQTRFRVADERGVIVVDGRLDGVVLNSAGSTIRGSGLLNGELVNRGKVSSGDSPGILNIVGRYEQLATGELEIELAGVDGGSQYDQVLVDGEAVLGGTLLVNHLDGFIPAKDTTFDVLSSTTLVDSGFSLALLDGGLVQAAMVDGANGMTTVRLTSIEGVRYAPMSGSWDEAGNWSNSVSPGVDDTAWLVGDPANNTTVMGPAADASVSSLVVGSGDETATSTTTIDLGTGVVSTTRGTTLRSDAQLEGEGALGGNLYNAGTVAPGDLAGAIHITGNYNQNEIGTLAIEIGGMMPGIEHDQLHVGGAAALDGTLNVSLVDLGAGPYQPAGGERFTILTADEAIAGGFASFNLPALEGNFAWDIDYLTNSVELRTFLRGDYNNNGAVEQADLDLVLLNWGVDLEFVVLPDEWINQRPTEGFIDQAALDLVLLNWGASIAPLGAVSVPEPSTACLILVGILAIGLLHRRATLEC